MTDLSTAISRLDDLFWVSPTKLKEICSHFRTALEDGLRSDASTIPMNITWVASLPTGDEKGSFLTIDLGGTNIRICWITLLGKGEAEVKQHHYEVSEEIKSGSAEELWEFVAASVEGFVREEGLEEEEELRLGFTFSYPARQEKIDHGVLQTWTKGFDIQGVEGEDVAEQLRAALKKKNLNVRLVALVNDTTGALIASHYADSETVIGAIFGTGCNAAYMEDCAEIPKLAQNEGEMAINCEYGAFDNDHKVLPRTKYDEEIDRDSPRPGEQTFEKMSAGLYLGEMFRLVLLDLHSQDLLFTGQNVSLEPYSLDTAVLSGLEDGEDPEELFAPFGVRPEQDELETLRHLAETITVRGARLCACGVAAICQKKGIKAGHIAADGSVVNKHPKFKQRWSQALGEILDWEDGQPIVMTSAEDGSGIGAAVIAALALDKRWA